MPTSVTSVSDLNTQLTKAGSRLVIIDFHAEWCGPCKVIGPIFDRLSNQYKQAVFLKCDVDAVKDVAAKYSISAMPTFIFLKNSNKVDQVRGADQRGLENTIKKHISGSGSSTDGHSWGKGNALGDGKPASAPLTASLPSTDQVTGLVSGLDTNSKIILGLVALYIVYLVLS